MPTELPDFHAVAAVPADLIERYRGRLPDKLIQVWQSYGFGSACDGFLKIVDPDQYSAELEGCIPRASLIPVLATGLADVICWDEAVQKNRIFRYRYGIVDAIMDDYDILLFHMLETEVLDMPDVWNWKLYPEAVARLGQPAYDECFAFTPLLALGGPETVENLETVKLTTHIQIITHLAGPIEY